MNRLSLPLLSKLIHKFLVKGAVPVLSLLSFIFVITAVPLVYSVPILTATKSDTLLVDNDADGVADPGDTIRYTAVLTNSGSMDAINVDFQDTIDANTTLVPGSVRTTPIARHDSYTAIGNVGITVPAGSGVLANDNDPDGTTPTLSVIAAAGATANGGAFALGSDGSFSYLPPAGFEGVDSFSYTSQDSDGNQDPATVFITVNEVIWFIDNSAGGGGDGRLATPFNSLAAYNNVATPDDPGDVIFLYETGSGSYSSGITLLNNQILIGQGASASLASIAGISVPTHSNALPATSGTRPTLSPSSGRVVTLASGNTVRGLNINQTSSEGLYGTNVGDQAISEVGIAGNTEAVTIIGGGTVNMTLDQVQATSVGTAGIYLQDITGGTTNLSNVDITSSTSGLFALNANTMNITGSSNTIVSTGGLAAVNITNTTIGGFGVTFQSVSASGANTGITLNNTGAGDFTITGSGATDGSGGALQNLNNHGIELINAQDVSISNMNLTNAALTQEVAPNTATCTNLANGNNLGCNAPVYMRDANNISLTNLTINGSVQHGINGNNVNGLSISNTDVTNIGDDNKENGMHFINLLGTVSFSNVSVDGSDTRNVLIENNTGTTNMTVTGSNFDNAGSEVGLDFLGLGTANITFSVTDSSFTHNNSVQLKVLAEDDSTIDATITGNDFDGDPLVTGNTGIDLVAADMGTLTFDVIGTVANPQTFQPFRSQVINIFASGGGTASGRVNGNTITGSAFGAGIRVVAAVTDFNGFNPIVTIEIDGNDIDGIEGVGLAGIHIEAEDGTNGLLGVASIDATVTNNTVRTTDNLFPPPAPSAADAAIQVYLNDLNLASTPQNRVCLNATGNATEANGGAFGETDFFFGNDAISGANSGVAQMQGFATSVSNTWFNVNSNTSTTTSPFADSLGPIGGGACATVAAVLNSPTYVVKSADTHSDIWAFVDKIDDMHAVLYQPQSATTMNIDHDDVVAAAVNVDGPADVAVAIPASDGKDNIVAKTANLPALSGESILVNLGDLNPGQVVVITFDVTVDATIPPNVTQVCNQGLFTSDNFADLLTDDLTVGGATDPTCTPAEPLPTFSFEKTTNGQDADDSNGAKPVLVVGDPLTWSYEVTNTGNSSVPQGDVNLVDDILGDLVLAGVNQGGVTGPAGDAGIIAELEPGETWVYTIVGTASIVTSGDPGAVLGSCLSSGPNSTYVYENEGTLTITGVPGAYTDLSHYCILSEADLSITKSDNADPVTVGGNVIYTITVNNAGPSDATNVVATDILPGSVTLVETVGCAEDPNGVPTCSLGAIPASGFTQYTIEVTTNSDGLITNNVSVTSDTTDPNSSNNSASEDTIVEPAVPALDYGDAPDSYSTSLGSGGPSHFAFSSFFMGTLVDPEPDGQPSLLADGDDLDTLFPSLGDDEDGVILPPVLTPGSVETPVVDGGLLGGFVDAWIDFDGSGVFDDPTERITPLSGLFVFPGPGNSFGFAVPAGSTPGFTYARFRLSSIGGLPPTGLTAPDGEVEDYRVMIGVANQPPVANNDSYSTNEDTALVEATVGPLGDGVLTNDSDVDGDALTAVLDTGTGNGVLVFNSDGSFTYTPTANTCGADSFTYHANDGTADSNIATVDIDVVCVNDAPVANNDSYSANEDTALVEATVGPLGDGVLLNDTDADNDPLTAVLDTGTSNGVLVLNSDGSFTYTPTANTCGADSFTYHANDGTADSNIATVDIDVVCVNDAPVANNDNYATNEDTALVEATVGPLGDGVLANDTDPDSDPLTAVLDTGTSNGVLVLNSDGSFTYTPTANYCGPDSFTYHANDGTVDSNIATVDINVVCVDDAPVAVDDTATVTEDDPATPIDVLFNDTDIDGGPKSIASVAQPANGTVVNNGADLTYEPDANYCNDGSPTDDFTYTLTPGGSTATVRVTVTCVNDAPVANNDSYSTNEDTALVEATVGPLGDGVLANDTDVENDSLTAVLDTGTGNGVLVFNSDGSFTYTPTADTCGPDSFTYHANDGTADSNIATVDIDVVCVNDAPVANNDSYSANEDMALVEATVGPLGDGVLVNDTDADSDPLTAVLDTGTSNGVLVLNSDGSFTYTPTANYCGADSFTYHANDGTVDSNIATVDIGVVCLNDDIYVTSLIQGQVNGFSFWDEDILVFNTADDSWAILFDGSDVGLAKAKIDAFALLDNGDILMSFSWPIYLAPLGKVDDSDIIKFIPTTTGPDTAGAFEFYFDGSDVGLTKGNEDIDALGLTPDGRLAISVSGNFNVPNVNGSDEDLIVFNATSLGTSTTGSWEMYFDGSDVGLTLWNEDVWGTSIDPNTGNIFLNTRNYFSVPGNVSGDGNDIFVCEPITTGNNTSCNYSSFWDGTVYRYNSFIFINSIYVD